MLAIIDYGVGNLFSLQCSFAAIGEQAVVTSDPAVLHRCDKLLLPGVGAFGDAMQKLTASGLAEEVRAHAKAGKPLMGICLGMQLLFEKSYEYGEHAGLGLLPGEVVSMKGTLPADLSIPQIGWNSLALRRSHPVLKYVREGDFVYFVHSFYVSGTNPSAVAVTDYGTDIAAVVAKDNICACQFHPEKSGDVGLSILRAFCEQ